MDALSRYLDEITEDGEEILVTFSNELLPLLSNTTPFGGRYSYYLYLAKFDFLSKPGFDAIVPGELVTRIFEDPPRVMVFSLGRPKLFELVPGLQRMLNRRYRVDCRFLHLAVAIRKDQPPQARSEAREAWHERSLREAESRDPRATSPLGP
jgi:hypothetical protein